MSILTAKSQSYLLDSHRFACQFTLQDLVPELSTRNPHMMSFKAILYNVVPMYWQSDKLVGDLGSLAPQITSTCMAEEQWQSYQNC